MYIPIIQSTISFHFSYETNHYNAGQNDGKNHRPADSAKLNYFVSLATELTVPIHNSKYRRYTIIVL